MERIIKDKKELVKLIAFLAMCDGGLYKKSKNAYYAMNSTSLQYCEYAAAILSNLTGTTVVPRKDVNTDGYTRQQQYIVRTKSHPLLTKIHSYLYVDKYKTVPSHYLKLMDAECLAMLYMADGSICYKGSAISSVLLNTKRLTEGDNRLLAHYLELVFGIQSTINRQNKYSYIRIKGKSIYKFFQLITPHILSDFNYKLPDDRLLQYKQDDEIVCSS